MSPESIREESSLSDQLIDQLQRRILNGQIGVGSWLRHASIANEFGMSRTPVREALRVLDARGIVTIVRNRGAQVNGLSGRDVRELGEVCAELEGLAARLAAIRIDDHQLGQLQQALSDFADAIDEYSANPQTSLSPEAFARWSDTNDSFHNAIVSASGSRQLMISLQEVSRRLPNNINYRTYAGNLRPLRRNFAEHKAVADAIASQDAEAAQRAMAEHIRSSTELLARLIEE